ncbi:MAG: quinone-dependent dihydroorotate dehydrogenase [Xanthomonadales bacterium]|nr:quinone-dependent dihydroorotate dehydrogenase [Xanthomonadales bacterium]
MFYRLAQKVLFATDPEQAHLLALQSLRLAHTLGATRRRCAVPGRPVHCMGLEFPNAVGVAAGLDKNAEYFEALGDLGFGFVEVGTITPRPQPGNPRPRVFRLPEKQALINRLGFNNKGVDFLVQRVREHRFKGILGINIGKNADTPMERAAEDYLHCLEKVYPWAGYITVNISSPNTRDLRSLQAVAALEDLLGQLEQRRVLLTREHGRRVPIAVKVAPDLQPAEIADIARVVASNRMDAVIATNTTIDREGVAGLPHAGESGGLSGRPLKPKADHILQAFRQQLPATMALVGVGGITCGQDAVNKLQLGANLVQFYTGMIYQGPGLVEDCLKAINGMSVE